MVQKIALKLYMNTKIALINQSKVIFCLSNYIYNWCIWFSNDIAMIITCKERVYSPLISSDSFKLLPLKSRDLRRERPLRYERTLLLKLLSLNERTCKLDGHVNPWFSDKQFRTCHYLYSLGTRNLETINYQIMTTNRLEAMGSDCSKISQGSPKTLVLIYLAINKHAHVFQTK